MTEKSKCNICGFHDFLELNINEGRRLVSCKRCGHFFLNPLPDKSLLDKLYSDEVYYRETPEDMDNIKYLWQRRFNSIMAMLPKEPGNILDVGCGKGLFLNEAKQRGWQIFGTEYSPHTAKYAVENYGIDVFTGDLLQTRYPDKYFKVISFWHVLEHLFSPSDYIKEAHRLLQNNGLLIIESPNSNESKFTIKEQMDQNKTHIHFFSEKGFRTLLENNGFEVLLATYEDLRHYKNKWSSRLHHNLDTALVKAVKFFTGKNTGSTLRIVARKTS